MAHRRRFLRLAAPLFALGLSTLVRGLGAQSPSASGQPQPAPSGASDAGSGDILLDLR